MAFKQGVLHGTDLGNPTSLDFGPDGRLYVSQQQNGWIYAYTIERKQIVNYVVTDIERITIFTNDTPNHNDDGSSNPTKSRLITGIKTAGTAANPVLYVTSSDPRISIADDSGLDTNSGTITRLTWTNGAWDRVDLVRGLPRSEENHATNGMTIDPKTNIMYVTSGGNTNKGAPSANLSGTHEYYLSAALLTVDLNQINGMPTHTDPRSGIKFVYDLPTLDDPTRNNITNSDPRFPYQPGHPRYNQAVDVGDPFGGNNGLNQAVSEPNGPVQVYSPGYRNIYDIVLTQSGKLYTIDNGSNAAWGGRPTVYNAGGNGKPNEQFNPDAGDYCTNEFNETDTNGSADGFHHITHKGYYGGHGNPTRAFPAASGIRVYKADANGHWAQDGPTHNFGDMLPPGLSIGNFPNNPIECKYTADLSAIEYVSTESTNGLAEYTASNELKGQILGASLVDGTIQAFKLNDAGTDIIESQDLFSGFGQFPLDVIALGDNSPYPGTVWVVTYVTSQVVMFEPENAPSGGCSGVNNGSDDDGDGYANSDEIANGTDPCSSASKPRDNDNDKKSDLIDTDDDNDGLADSSDPFAIDPNNGRQTFIPLRYDFFSNNPGTGLLSLGFTGMMTNGTDHYLTQFDSAKLAAGGTAGLLTVEQVTTGDAQSNDQDNAFQLGLAVNSQTPPFYVQTRLLSPFFNGTSKPDQSFGFYIGNGDQNNYAKLVLDVEGINMLVEQNGVVTHSSWSDDFNLVTTNRIDLYLHVNPAAPTAQSFIAINGGEKQAVGDPIAIPSAWFSLTDTQGLALGVISTTPNTPYAATWDFLNVQYLGAGDTPAPAPSTPSPTSPAPTPQPVRPPATAWKQLTASDGSVPQPRHEGGYVELGGKFYLIGGRGERQTSVYNPSNQTWTNIGKPPLEIHHVQPVAWGGKIYVVGALTGVYPNEVGIPNVLIFDPADNSWTEGEAVPADRVRGSAGIAVHNNKIYIVGGTTNGHRGGYVDWFDEYNPATGAWNTLPDAPRARDHFAAGVANNKLIAAAGRRTEEGIAQLNTIPEVDTFNFNTGAWESTAQNIPTLRAGTAAVSHNNEVIIIGGETTADFSNRETEALNVDTGAWRKLPNLNIGRHGTGAVLHDNRIYVASGNSTRGGGSEITSHEMLFLGDTPSPAQPQPPAPPVGGVPCPGNGVWPAGCVPSTSPSPAPSPNPAPNPGGVPCPSNGAWPAGCVPSALPPPSPNPAPAPNPGGIPCPTSGAWPAGCVPSTSPAPAPAPNPGGVPCPASGTWPAGCVPSTSPSPNPAPNPPAGIPCPDSGVWPIGCVFRKLTANFDWSILLNWIK